jgi:MFS transporter, PPP family, 3-phenylpropionic acid transporter
MAAQMASYSSSAGAGAIDDASEFSDIGATGLERNAIWREEARYDHHDRSGSAIGVMVGNPQIPTGSGFAWRLAAFYAALFMALGVQLPFLPVWLAAKGLDAAAIGLVLAIPMVVRVFAIPLAARSADHYDALRTAIAIAGAAAVLGYGALALAQGTAAIMATFAFASACYTPLMPLADAYAFLGLRRRGADRLPAYGPVRLWGSAAFIAGSFGAGFLLDVIAPRELIWLVVVAMMLAAAAAWLLVPLPGGEAPARRPPHPTSGLLRERAFLAMAAAASLVQASHALYYGFSTLEWQAAGLGGGAIAALWALGVVAEMALFAVSARLPITPETLLLIGAAGAVVRWSAMALDPPPALLPPLQCLHGLSFGATHLGAVAYIARVAPAEQGATAQGYLAVAQGLVMAAAMGLSGLLYARWGGPAYGAMALAAAIGGVCALAAGRWSAAGAGAR